MCWRGFFFRVPMKTTQLCATVTAGTMEELCQKRDQQDGADLVELRLDSPCDPDVRAALRGRQVPVLVTCRPKWEGGEFGGSEEERRRILLEAVDEGAEYVDVEHNASFLSDVLERRQGRGVVVSYHAFAAGHHDVYDRYRAMRATGAEVVKIAVAVDSLYAGAELMRIGDKNDRRVMIGMGSAGVPTRILAGRYGMCWTYAGEGVAPGQVSLEGMRDQFRVRRVTENTMVYGVLGAPVRHSVSPVMHNAGFNALGLDAVYLPLEASDIDDFSAFARVIGLRGASVTAPFKENVASCVSEMDETAEAVGAVNTVLCDGDQWVGRNTDVTGFLAPLIGRMSLAGKRAIVIGAGGAARGVAWGLVQQGAKVRVCARRLERAESVSRSVGAEAGEMPPAADSWDLLVNTTPVGTFPNCDESPLPDGVFGKGVVYDLIYNPRTTRLLAQASEAGCDTIGGLEMLVAQAREQFAWWTGVQPAEGVFEEAAQLELMRQDEVEGDRRD